MNMAPLSSYPPAIEPQMPAAPARPEAGPADPQLREAFDDFVGQTLFGQMLKSMRKSLGKPAYFHGGRAEEIFQQQLDQVMAEKMSEAASDRLTDPMFELFSMPRR